MKERMFNIKMFENSVYLETFKQAFLEEYIYKANTLVKILRNVLSVFILFSIWKNLFRTNSISNMDVSDMMLYVILSLFIQNLVNSRAANILIEKIRDGSIIINFIRPVRLDMSLFFNQLGTNTFNTLFSTLPVCLTALLFIPTNKDITFVQCFFFLLSSVMGIFLMFLIQYNFALCVFWLKTGVFINTLSGLLFQLFGGTMIPLWFYPDALVKASGLLPFRLVVFEPIAIFMGKTAPSQIPGVLASQFIWIGLLVLLKNIVWARAQKVITVQGG